MEEPVDFFEQLWKQVASDKNNIRSRQRKELAEAFLEEFAERYTKWQMITLQSKLNDAVNACDLSLTESDQKRLVRATQKRALCQLIVWLLANPDEDITHSVLDSSPSVPSQHT